MRVRPRTGGRKEAGNIREEKTIRKETAGLQDLKREGIEETIEPVLKGLGITLIEVSCVRHRGSTQVRVTVDKPGKIGTEECSLVYRAILPRLELALGDRDLYLEVSSPGIDRVIKEPGELVHFIGRGVRCYRRDTSSWIRGILRGVDEGTLSLEGKEGLVRAPMDCIGKARLDSEEDY